MQRASVKCSHIFPILIRLRISVMKSQLHMNFSPKHTSYTKKKFRLVLISCYHCFPAWCLNQNKRVSSILILQKLVLLTGLKGPGDRFTTYNWNSAKDARIRC